MHKLLLALIFIASTASAGPNFGDEIVTDDFLVYGDHVIRIIPDQTVQLRWKRTLNKVWTYDPNPNEIYDCGGLMVAIDRVAMWANRVLVMGTDGCGRTKYHLLNKASGALVRQLDVHAYEPIYCGVRATLATVAVCVATGYSGYSSTGIKVFNAQTGHFTYQTPVQPGVAGQPILNWEYLRTTDFAILNGILVWGYDIAVDPDLDYTMSRIIAYNMSTGGVKWVKTFPLTAPFMDIEAGVVKRGLLPPYPNTYYAAMTGKEINW